jgi:hypothetical protein
MKYKVIWSTPINVNGKLRQPNEEFEDELTTTESKALIVNKYISKWVIK